MASRETDWKVIRKQLLRECGSGYGLDDVMRAVAKAEVHERVARPLTRFQDRVLRKSRGQYEED